MNPERVFGLLEESNPVPDLSTVREALGLSSMRLPIVESGRDLMQTGKRDTNHTTSDQPVRDPNRRSRLLIGAAAALLVLIAGLGTWAVFGGSDNDEAAAEVTVVLSHYEAWNNGDYAGYLATFTDELAQEEAGDIPQIFINANSHIEIVEPCRVVATSPTGDTTVQCGTSTRDDFFGPAGFADTGTETIIVNAGGKIARRETAGECCDAEFAFNREFWQWLQIAHSDVYREIQPLDADSGAENLPGFERDPAHMSIAIQYVEEFVAQSDAYPITP